ncbi:MAG: glycosyltransferase family 9 protein [Bacteroidota bacterium]
MPKHERILVIRTDRIGDVVLATPLIRGLRQSFPTAYIAALVRPYTRDLLLHNPHLDEILVDDPDGTQAGRTGFWDQVRALRKHRFDTALLLLPTERLAWILFFAGIRTRVSVGLRLYQVLTLMKTVSRHKYIPLRHEADYCLDLGRAIGVEANDLTAELYLTEEERSSAATLLERHGVSRERGEETILVGVHPGHGHSAPNWKPERYVEFASRLLKHENVFIILTGGEREVACSAGFDALRSSRLINLVNELNLRELMGVISHSDLLVSASTGPMHLAAGLQVPTLSLFCPLTACSPQLWGPLGNRAEVVLPPDEYCSRSCPGDPHICDLEGGILPANIYEKAIGMLSHRPWPGGHHMIAS